MPLPAFLLLTKFHLPPARAELVSRPRLVALLNEGLARPLTLISAPAGFGKTTLLSHWRASASGRALKVASLGLDAGDNEPARFLAYLAAALGNIQTGLGETALAALQSLPPPAPSAVVTALLNDLSTLSDPAVLILDDYHVIEAQAVHDSVAFLLEHLPERMHVVIATRADPPLPLPRLRAHNQLLEIRADQLRFTPDEAAAFLAGSMKLPLTSADIARLTARTEGWIAGLQLAALSMQDRADLAGFVRDFSGTHRYILDYLAEEALRQQPQSTQDFLMATSVLDRFCASLCAEVLGEPEPACQAMLEYLERANLFLIALDDERRWYRYHHLFADLLRSRQQQAQPERVPRLHERASRWHEQNGSVAEAIQHALLAQAGERAADLIERYGPARWSVGDPSILLLASGLPAEMLSHRPRLALYQAWLWIAQGQAPPALRLLRGLQQSLSRPEADPTPAWVNAFIDLLLATLSDLGRDQALAALPAYEALAQIPDSDLGLRPTAAYLYALALNRRGQFERAAEILQAAIQRDPAGRETIAVTLAVPILARIRIMQGDLPEAARLCRDYLRLAAESTRGPMYGAGGPSLMLGEVLYEWNDLAGAEQQIRAGLQANALWQNFILDAMGLEDLVSVQLARGNIDGARETLQRLAGLVEGRTASADLTDEISVVQVRFWLATGELARAAEWADQRRPARPDNFLQAWDQLPLARVRMAQGRHAEAQAVLEALAQLPGAASRPNRQLRANLLLALALAGQSRWAPALAALEAGLALAEPGGFCRVFVDCGEPARALLAAYLRSPAPRHQAYAQRLLAAFPAAPRTAPPAKPSAAMVEPLTNRELEVLRLVAQGCSNREVAGKLSLAEGTVKFHVHAVLDKLQVRSRTQAIVRAKELKLI